MVLALIIFNAQTPERAAAATTAYTIDCNLQAQYPHASTHYPGRVNIVATVTCTAPVNYIVIGVALTRNGTYVSPSGSCDGENTAYLKCNASEPCHSGSLYGGQANSQVIFPPGGVVLKQSATDTAPNQLIYCDELDPDNGLNVGDSIQSPNEQYSLNMQSDGNLVEYGPNGAIWASCTNSWPGSIATMQDDGNFVVYGPGHIARYATGTSSRNSVLQVQNDGNMVIYAPGHVAVWASAQHRIC